MAIYTYKCEGCGAVFEKVCKMSEHKAEIPCMNFKYKCFAKAKQIFNKDCVSNNNLDYKPFWHENLGHEPVYITSRVHFKKELKKRGLECVG